MSTNNSFIGLLADRLAMEESIVKNYLNELIADIHKGVSNNEEVALGSLGVFYKKLDGSLGFRPSAETMADINFRYVNLDPFRIEYQEPGEDEINVESPVMVIEEELIEEKSNSELSAIIHATDVLAEPIIPDLADDTLIPQNSTPYSRINNRKSSYRHKKASFILLSFFLSLFILLGLLLEGYIHYPQALRLLRGLPLFSTTDTSVITEELITQPSYPQYSTVDSDTSSLAVVDVNENPLGILFGFRGVYDSTLTGYYTIISKTFFDETAADQSYQMALLKGYRARKVNVVITNRSVWQLHIGQFQHRVQATVAVDSLEQGFKSFNIVKMD